MEKEKQMKKVTAEELLQSEFDIEELNNFINTLTEGYKQKLKKGLSDLAVKQIDERMIQPSNAVVDALFKLVDQD